MLQNYLEKKTDKRSEWTRGIRVELTDVKRVPPTADAVFEPLLHTSSLFFFATIVQSLAEMTE